MSTTLILAGVLLLSLSLHPFATYPLSLRLLARWHPRSLARLGATPQTAALCVCAYNEESVIRAKVENMLAMRAVVPTLDILVYVDAATDGTAAILAEYVDRVRVVVSPTRLGKTHGMNVLVGMTDADIIVFSDANVTSAPDTLPRLLAPFADPTVGCACGHLVYTRPNESVTATTGSFYWWLEERIKALESASGSVMGADGSIFAIRRSLHRPPPPDLIDDMYVSLAVLCDGGRVVRVPDAVAYEEAVSRPDEEFRRKIRIACQAFNVHRALWPRLRSLPLIDQYKYVSHKLLRWVAIYLFAAGAALVLGGLALAGAWLTAVILLYLGVFALAAIALAHNGPLATARDILGAFVATGFGVARSLRGDRFQTWNPPASARRTLSPAFRSVAETRD